MSDWAMKHGFVPTAVLSTLRHWTLLRHMPKIYDTHGNLPRGKRLAILQSLTDSIQIEFVDGIKPQTQQSVTTDE